MIRLRSTSLTEARIVVVRSSTMVDVDSLRNRCLQEAAIAADAIDRLNDVGAGLAEDNDGDGSASR